MSKKYNINGDEYTFINDIRESRQLRKSFNLLANNTFGLNFESWYQNGYWSNNYIPYVLINGDEIVSNVSVNIINTRWENQAKHYIQLGTIMTHHDYQGKGLSRWLMEKVLKEWEDKCDAVYLFANDRVVDFYPKFGFEEVLEYQYHKIVEKRDGTMKKLDMSLEYDRKILLDTYKFSNPFSALPVENNEGLLMFYCSQFMRENIYYNEQYEAIVVTEYDDEVLVCYDIFCKNKCTIDDILGTMTEQKTKMVTFGFTPKKINDFKITKLQEDDTTLFVLRGKENLFANNQLMFPLLSRA